MPASDLTKKALAAAMKGLLAEQPFAKISVGDICEQCGMHRKSFYYHFKDKYDLVNWIFYNEFVSNIQSKEYETTWDFLEDICVYFYANRAFYTTLLSITGQNSFREYFQEIVQPLILAYYATEIIEEPVEPFVLDFLGDTMLLAIVRWLTASPCMPPQKFVGQLRRSIQSIARYIVESEEQIS